MLQLKFKISMMDWVIGLRSLSSDGTVAVREERESTENDLDRVTDMA
jgi:hypothetical protein